MKTVPKKKSADFESNMHNSIGEKLSVDQSKSSVTKFKVHPKEKISKPILPIPVKQDDLSIVPSSKSSSSKKSIVDIPPPALPLVSENSSLFSLDDSIPVTSVSKHKSKTAKKTKKTLPQTPPPFYYVSIFYSIINNRTVCFNRQN